MTQTKRIAILASGTGTNAREVIRHFKNSKIVEISIIISNRANAGVLEIAKEAGIPTLVINIAAFEGNELVREMKHLEIDLVVLAGFLWQIPKSWIDSWPSRILNLHPALLPAYGGKGMYGNAVHSAVINDKCAYSGISIHLVDDQYDTGKVLFQATTSIAPDDTPESLAHRIHTLEHRHYPAIIESYLDVFC